MILMRGYSYFCGRVGWNERKIMRWEVVNNHRSIMRRLTKVADSLSYPNNERKGLGVEKSDVSEVCDFQGKGIRHDNSDVCWLKRSDQRRRRQNVRVVKTSIQEPGILSKQVDHTDKRWV